MVKILSVSTAQPAHRVEPEELRSYVRSAVTPASATRFCRILDRSEVRSRHTVAPLAELLALRTVEQRAHRFARDSLVMGEAVAREALRLAGIAPTEISTLISVSSTGYSAPSLDAHLVERLALRPTVRRIPITQLGCSAGVSAIATAADLARASSGGALVVSVEICSLSLQNTHSSRTDLIASILFGDGAAAIVLSGRGDHGGLEIVASRTVLLYGSLHRVGIRVSTSGLRLVLSREMPSIVRQNLPQLVGEFLHEQGLDVRDLSFWLVHPGGPRILEAVEQCFGLSGSALEHSWDVWRDCGNMSSATAFFVLDRWLTSATADQNRGLGILIAFGPGVTCEMVLLRSPVREACAAD